MPISPGTIERLVLVAGPSGSGKTTFLSDPAQYLPAAQLPPELADLHALTPEHRAIRGFATQPSDRLAAACVHVDLSFPLRSLKPASREDLLGQLKPALYAAWDELLHCVRGAPVVDVVSYYVCREVHFRRWLYGKHFPRNPGGGTLSTMVAIHADDTDNDALHSAVYQAWFRFLDSVPLRSHHVVDGSTDHYRILRAARFSAQMGWLNDPSDTGA